jgi:hypothetical protein
MSSLVCSVCARKYSDYLSYCPYCTIYVLGGKTFNTKKELGDYLISLKKEVGTVYPKGTLGYQVLYALIVQGHRTPEEKIRGGIREFFVEEDCKGTTRFTIRHDEGTILDFGYAKCKKHLATPKDIIEKTDEWTSLLSACRVSVKDQTGTFFRNNLHVCADCGVNEETVEYATDHYDPEFVELVIAFDTGRVDTPTIFEDLPPECINIRLGAKRFRDEDCLYAQAFQDYHKRVAKLQILCVPCNLKKPRYPGIKAGVRRTKIV